MFDDLDPTDNRFLMSTGPFHMDTWIDDNLDGFPQVGNRCAGGGLGESSSRPGQQPE